jgi:putative DNA primase/helicase
MTDETAKWLYGPGGPCGTKAQPTATNGQANGKAAIVGDRHRQPAIPAVDRNAIHDGLTSFDRWLAWRYTWKKKKWDKPPVDARTGQAGSSTNPATWCSFNEAMRAHRPGIGGLGVGFGLGEADCNIHFSGVDLDDCRNPETGELSEVAREIVATMDSYTEVSPSGTGVKILVIGKLPEGARTKNKAGTVEVYSSGRYFTITGQRIEGTPKRVEHRQEQLVAVWEKYIGSEQKARKAASSESTNGHATPAALAAMLRIKPPAGENDGSKRLFAICCRAVEHDLSDAAAVDAVRQYSASHPFPADWSDDDILRRVRDAEREVARGSALSKASWPTTDVGNAERFSRQHGADVRYCHPWNKWLVFDGRRWAMDSMGEVMRRAKRVARSILVEASQIEDGELREQLAKWAAASERRERLGDMIVLAESEQPIPIAVESLDSHPWLLNCENGTVDLKTGELREHRREDYLTKLCPLEYPTEPGDEPDLWLEFLDRIFDGKTDLIGFLQRLIGMALVGDVLEHVLPIFYGVGANGKSVFLETVCGMLGPDYAMHAPQGLLMASKSDRHPTELADLHGKRFVAAVETADGGRLSESLVKELTGGDSIRARRMREDFWQFRPSHTVVLATNHKPNIRGTDHGIWRRIRLVPFSVIIPDHEQDKQLSHKLRIEWPAILRWAVTGCLTWQRDGLKAPDEVKAATDEYKIDMDVLGEFIDECCVIDPEYETPAGALFAAYKAWAEKRGEFVESQTKFGTRLAERGFVKDRASGGANRGRVQYRGIGIVSGL